MQLLTTEVLILMMFINSIQAELSPVEKNVCLHTETYQETIEGEVSKPVQKTEKRWCFRPFSFTCYKTVTLWKKVKEPLVVQRTKIVPKCCNGYKEEATRCFPICLKGCRNGKCVAPDICACAPGFYGTECEKECPENFWGKNCTNKCDCTDNGKCNKTFGGCDCESGWWGKRCELPCQDGYYGYYCKEKCNCENSLCNYKTGKCIITTAVTTARDTLPSTQNKETTMDFVTKLPPEIHQQTEMSITIKDEIATTISQTETKVNSVAKGNLLGAIGFREVRTILEEVTSNTPETFEMSFSSDLKNITEKIMTENKTKKITAVEMVSSSSDIEDTSKWISYNGSLENVDINERNNFISERKERSDSQRIFTMLYFLPSFSVISGVSFLIIIITAKWVISKHRKKARKMQLRAIRNENVFQQEEIIKFQTDNFFWVKNCKKNPVCLSDVDLNNTRPILKTFKPMNPEQSLISKGEKIK